jgi:hypothetical protein
VATDVTAGFVAPEGGGATQFDGPQRSALSAAQGMAITLKEGLAILAHDISDFELGSAVRGWP